VVITNAIWKKSLEQVSLIEKTLSLYVGRMAMKTDHSFDVPVVSLKNSETVES